LYWNPGSEAIDAFSQNCQFDNNWLVPPVFSVLGVIKILPNPHDQLIYLYNQPFHFQIVESTECL
jgi:hypothetical protein